MNLSLEFKVIDVPSQLIKLTYDIPTYYSKHICPFARPFLMTSPPADILYQQKAVNGYMINNTTFFVRQPASFCTAKAEAEMAFYCMLTGNACMNINKRLHQGQYILINDNSIPLLLNLEPGIYELHQYGYTKTHLINLTKATYPRTIFIQLLQAINEVKFTRIDSSLTEIWLETKLREILILFLDDHLSPQKEEYLDFISNNLDKEISISKLAKMYYISESTLRRSFIKKFGIPFSLYLQKVRLEKGEELLAHTNKHIHEIALQVGYRSAAAFTHAFKQHFGYTPSIIRERNAIVN
ncbi:AraC-type DNA-binding protein [Chitinophaga sp. YR573]|uniref:helix-turn-helix transcriptional regulator n=1 Tax=Chitinophaga sp. YR573 TaxID=1881040 RepID=UPI0008B06049|nr:AraC family transcriptional regulator [Chitinophaga sp. YR573]SEW44197.1 AraC-type DNA-binding protein [Chitinophaga sp. YR573]